MKKFIILDVYPRPLTMTNPPFREDILSDYNYLCTRIRSAIIFKRTTPAHHIKIMECVENKLYFIGTVEDALNWCKRYRQW